MQRYQDRATRAAYLITGDATEAEDATHEGFVRASYALSRFHAGAPFRPWLLPIVVNEARNRRKAEGRRARLALMAAEEHIRHGAPSPETLALAEERRLMLLQALDA